MEYLHTMLRVTDVDASLHFYCDLLGDRVNRYDNAEEGHQYFWRHPAMPTKRSRT